MNCLPYDDVIPTQQWLVRDAYNNMTFADKGSKVIREPLFPFLFLQQEHWQICSQGTASKGDPSSCIYTQKILFFQVEATQAYEFFFLDKSIKVKYCAWERGGLQWKRSDLEVLWSLYRMRRPCGRLLSHSKKINNNNENCFDLP